MQLTYLNRKSVLKYLEPNLRIQLSMRCPSVQLCEKTFPLHIRELCWNQENLKINETYYKTTKATRKARKSSQEYVLLGLEIDGCTSTERVVLNTTYGKVMTYVLKKILGDRKIIAKHTCIRMDIDAFQNSRNLVTETLEIYTGDLRETLESLTSIFHPSTFPLKALRIFRNVHIKHPIIQNSRLLVVPDIKSMRLVSNKRVHTRYFDIEEACSFIHHLLEHGKEVGTHFSAGSFSSEDDVKASYARLLKYFGPNISKRSMEPPSVAMNIDNFSELAIDCEEFQKEWRLNFKVHPREDF